MKRSLRYDASLVMHDDAQVMHLCYTGLVMKAITLRNLPPEVARFVRKKAQADKTSLNKTVIGMLEEAAGVDPKPRKRRDLSRWAGTWSTEEADAFDQALAEQRKIDPEIWK